jgi:hypothetical protein
MVKGETKGMLVFGLMENSFPLPVIESQLPIL